jgi:ABC-type phosphate/phosphonate transport system substrate-binding protein
MLRHLLKITLFVFLLLFSGLSPAASQEPMNFVVIQPGQPGSAEEARPVMDSLASYLASRLGDDVLVSGSYFNRTEEALAALEKQTPQWGIVSLGFFVEQGDRFALQPIAATRPGGSEHDRWHLVVARDQVADWRKLCGQVQGTMLFQAGAAAGVGLARLLFDAEPQQLPFALQGTFSPLRAVRDVARGKAAGAVLDQPQYQALQSLPLMKELTVIHRSAPLPTAAVVWFGQPGPAALKLADVLRRMADDPAAGDLLQLLQTEGFGPADPALVAGSW